MMRAMPALVSMPMMLGATADANRSATRSSCDEHDDRISEMDERIEALHVRMMTIQRSVELQTKILEELRASGSIGGTRLPGLSQTQPGT